MKQITSQAGGSGRRRGRPLKFGRPARLVAMTLPDDVIGWLQTLDADPGRAVVALFNREDHGPSGPASLSVKRDADLVEVAEGRALILVNPVDVMGLPGVAAIPFVGGRAFLALEPGQNLADLELAVVDALEAAAGTAPDRVAPLARLRDALRAWRRDPSLRFRERSIIVAERARARRRGPAA